LLNQCLSSIEETAKGKLARVRIKLADQAQHQVSTHELAQAWRSSFQTPAGAESVTFSSHLFRVGNPIEVHLTLDDNKKLTAAAEELKKELSAYPGVFEVGDNFYPGKPEMRLSLKPTARSLGLTLDDLATQVRHAFYGANALTMLRGQDEVKVVVRYPEEERSSLLNLEQMRIRTAEGLEVPFSEVAQVEMAQGYASIERARRKRVIKVTADVDEQAANANQIRQWLSREYLPGLQDKYFGLRFAIEGEGKEQATTMSDIYLGFALALMGIYALLAIPFKSYSQPFIVLLAVPFGFTGALLGHLITGYNLSILSAFGMVGLAGVVVNDALVLVDAVNRLRGQGLEAAEAVVQGGILRFRAIVLTSVTTFVGLAPMLFETSVQAQFLIPMAVSLGFGVLFATLVTLLLVPSCYMILEDVKGLAARLFSRRPPLVEGNTGAWQKVDGGGG
jgi:multidrug efflux pump subunit AcrB